MSDTIIKKNAYYLRWLALADEDLRFVKKALRDEDCINVAIFHAQQCAEKALKSFLAFHNAETERVHDLVKLVRNCSKINPEFMQLLPQADSLNPYQTKTRYPDDCFIIPSLDTLKISIDEAEQILNYVLCEIEELERKQSSKLSKK